ncbi:MAG: sensor histidine kinase [Planctomycetota bacterium]|jgi:signal transduction histidine kinase
MTLRRRLLLVYLIVVLLSVATVGFAVFELRHAHRIIRELQDWNAIVLNVEKLKYDWPPPPKAGSQEFDLNKSLAKQFQDLSKFEASLDVERVRDALLDVYQEYNKWKQLPAKEQNTSTDLVLNKIRVLTGTLGYELEMLNIQADQQSFRIFVLLVLVIGLTLIHIVVVGGLLRRWLLWPMEQLNRQVEALARDEPPEEPLLTAPLEMAQLAGALDRARQSLGELRQQVIQSERMTILGQFATQLAHNLRNPLASIRAVAQTTARHAGDNQSFKENMNEIISSVDRLNYWIEGLMEIARRQPATICNTDVIPLLKHLGETLEKELSAKKLTLSIITPDGELTCRHDPVILEHALIAIITNAIEASGPEETITLTARGAYDEQQGRTLCRIAVIDRGAGIKAENPDQIFDFSYSTKQQGMGLGLALARLSLQHMGGIVYADNNPQQGTTIHVELPIDQESHPEPQA